MNTPINRPDTLDRIEIAYAKLSATAGSRTRAGIWIRLFIIQTLPVWASLLDVWIATAFICAFVARSYPYVITGSYDL